MWARDLIKCGGSSVVELLLAKQKVAGSIPVLRSIYTELDGSIERRLSPSFCFPRRCPPVAPGHGLCSRASGWFRASGPDSDISSCE